MRLRFVIVFFILLICSLTEAQVGDSLKFQSLPPYYFHLTYLKEDPALMIDVREFSEFKWRRIKDAIDIPSSGNLDFATDTIDKKVAIFLYCTTDSRSDHVAKIFIQKGFKKVFSLKGGLDAWKKDGFPIERKRVKNRK